MSIRTVVRCLAPVAVMLLLAGCGGTTIKSDLVLDPAGSARLELNQSTEAIDLRNDSENAVRVTVLGKKDKVLTNMVLNGRDQVQLNLLPARAIQFDNTGRTQAVVRWTLRNSKAIEYSMQMQPGGAGDTRYTTADDR